MNIGVALKRCPPPNTNVAPSHRRHYLHYHTYSLQQVRRNNSHKALRVTPLQMHTLLGSFRISTLKKKNDSILIHQVVVKINVSFFFF